MNDISTPQLNTSLDREIDEHPPDLKRWFLTQSTGDGYPGRRNATSRPADEEAASAFADQQKFQDYGGWEATNAINSNDYLHNPSELYYSGDRQPVMPLEVTGSLKTQGYYQVKSAADLNHSGLFSTDQLDPRPPESLQNLLNQPTRTGMGVTEDQAVSKMFNDLNSMNNSNTLNPQGEGTISPPATAKEAVLRAIRDARHRYQSWR